MSGNNGGYSGYGGVGNGVNNGGLDFEAQFKNMVVTPVPVAQQTNSAGQTSLVEKLKDNKSKILLIVMAVLAGAGASWAMQKDDSANAAVANNVTTFMY